MHMLRVREFEDPKRLGDQLPSSTSVAPRQIPAAEPRDRRWREVLVFLVKLRISDFDFDDDVGAHAMDTTNAILLRKRKLSETSSIISWCTDSLGCIQTVAKGARRARSPFAGKLDLFFETEISIATSRKSNLHTLREVVLTNPFPGIRQKLSRMQTAAYFVELIELCTESDHHEPELFALLRRALRFLNENDPTLRAVDFFERELAKIAGVHDKTAIKSNAALALSNLFGKLPKARGGLLAELRRAAPPQPSS